MPTLTRIVTVWNPDACLPAKLGCMSSDAMNYDPTATADDGSCVWGNDPTSEVYTKNDCPAGQTGSEYTLNVLANEYTVSVAEYGLLANKAKANEIRDNDMITRGQTLANDTGYCILPDPEETGVVELIRVEYQRELLIGEFTRPAMIRAIITRSSTGGSSGVTGFVQIRQGSPSADIEETTPPYSIPAGDDCDTTGMTSGIVEGPSYYASLTVDQENYDVALPGYVSINFVDDFSTDMNCT